MRPAAPGAIPESFLSRRNPSAKLAVVTFLSLIVLPVFDPITPTLLYAVALLGVGAGAGMPLRTLMVRQVPFAIFGTSLLVVNAVTRGGAVLLQLGPFEVTTNGLQVGSALAIRTLLVGVTVVGFVASTDPLRLLTSLRQQLRLPDQVAFALLAAYRLLDELPRRWEDIRRAQVARRPAGRLRPGTLARAAFTLLVTAIRDAERLAVTLELRGLGAGPRTTWKPASVDRTDLVMIVVSTLTTGGLVILSAANGWLRGVSALTAG